MCNFCGRLSVLSFECLLSASNAQAYCDGFAFIQNADTVTCRKKEIGETILQNNDKSKTKSQLEGKNTKFHNRR